MENEKAIPAQSRSAGASPQVVPLNFKPMQNVGFDFELKPNEFVLYMPGGLLYDEKNGVYWLYFVLISPGVPNRYFRVWSYDLNFSGINMEKTNCKYAGIGLMANGSYLNAWYVVENGAFMRRMAASPDGVTFTEFNPIPAVMEVGEDNSFWLDKETGRFWQFERNLRPSKEKRRQAVRYSDDNGLSWSDKSICLEIPESERTKPHGVFQYCVVYSMSVCKHNGIFYSAVNVFNEATDIVSIRMAKSLDLYNWEWMNGGNDVIPLGNKKQMFGSVCNYIEPGVNDVPPKLIILVQSSDKLHGEVGIFRFSIYENILP